ncbi:MAG: peptidylprolyl isomerase [Sulfurimonas sp.]|jgi:FKBP-type peptidyl-prolyl cis-trans isomerase SlyD|uniref:FKBP-type peptidyl-prolyl cis-trans isomerase n=1 Tax=Sulfurimonas sp. TaxID=2022749 RepID=UPI0026066461|nr:peptidylprolyl isomerase [Sulfurimonas sp.]MDD3475804.1 peptidylprolyl isomerase [Sulfurimonas sp.]
MAIQKDQIVSIEYEVNDGTKVVDSNIGGLPLVFMFGRGQIIPGLENAITNMSIGEKADVVVKAEDAYGEYDAAAKQEVPKDQFAGIDLEIGMSLYGQGEDGGTVQVVVQEIGDENVIIDFNHPLAGKELSFLVIVNNIREASAEELMSGIPAENQQDDCCGTGGGTGCGC